MFHHNAISRKGSVFLYGHNWNNSPDNLLIYYEMRFLRHGGMSTPLRFLLGAAGKYAQVFNSVIRSTCIKFLMFSFLGLYFVVLFDCIVHDER